MNKNNLLICLTGLPASGKTTFANCLKDALEKKFIDLIVKIIDPDLIRKNLTTDKFDPEKEPIVREENLKLIKSELEKGNTIISDDLNYYSSMRHDLKDIADSFNLNFFIVHIATPLEICLKWNENRGETIPNEIILRINERFDEFNRYNWDIPIATYDLSKISDLNFITEELSNEINRKLDILKTEIEPSKIKAISNIDNEKLDKITRNYVGTLLDKNKFLHLKKRIIKLRKIFVKKNKNKALSQSEITRSFKTFLEKNLNITISEDFL